MVLFKMKKILIHEESEVYLDQYEKSMATEILDQRKKQ